MDFSMKKLLVIFTIVVGPPVMGMVIISTPMMETYHRWVVEDPHNEKSDWIDHKWLLLKSAEVCYQTMREDRAALHYYDYLRLYPEDLRMRPIVLLSYGDALNEANMNKEALVVYGMILEEYPNRPLLCKAAGDGIKHIRYYKPN